MLSLGLAVSASAQPKLGGMARRGFSAPNVRSNPKTNVTVIVPSYRFNPYYGGLGYRSMYGFASPYAFGYSPFADPFYPSQRVVAEPSPLDLAIDDIKEEYNYRIDNAKDDKNLSKDERKQLVRDLKHQREDAIIEAKKNYYQKKNHMNQDQQ
jgi:hypothetical protein